MLWLVAPLLHKYEEAKLEVSATDMPGQMAVEPPAAIVGVAGEGKIVAVMAVLVGVMHPSKLAST